MGLGNESMDRSGNRILGGNFVGGRDIVELHWELDETGNDRQREA